MIHKELFHIFRRELRNYFNTPIGYVFLFVSLLFNFLFFFLGAVDPIVPFWETRIASIRSYMNLLPITFILMVPAVSMRIWAEEKKSGTIEILTTLPVTELDLVVAKFLAAFSFVSTLIFASLPLALSIWMMGDMDVGGTIALYLGSFLMAGAYVAMGMVISMLTTEQVVAFILIFLASLFMFFTNFYIVSRHLPPEIARLAGFFSHSYHFASFSRGMVSFGDLFYYVSFIALMLHVNVSLLRRAG